MRAVRGNLGGFVLLPGQASGKFPMWLINANPKSAEEGAANSSELRIRDTRACLVLIEIGEAMASISGKVDPVVCRVSPSDIAEALVQGLRDFQAAPLYGLAFGGLYAAGGIIILLCLTAFGMVYLAYPLAAGFALIGPFVAIGLYEVSRRLEAKQPISVRDIWTTVT